MSRIVPRWAILSIETVTPVTYWLASINGIISASNFLPTGPIELPAIREACEDLTTFDVMKITWFIDESEVRPDPDMTLALADRGIKYEKETVEGWILLYEDMEQI